MKKRVLIIIISAAVLLVAAAGVVFYFSLPNDRVVAAFDETNLTLIVESEYIKDAGYQPKMVDDEILLPIEAVKKFFDKNIYWDEALKKVTVTTKDKVIRMKTGSLEAMINNKPVELKIPATVQNEVVYMPIEFLSDFYGIEINHVKEKKVVMIDYSNKIKRIGEPETAEAVIRSGRTVHSPILRKFAAPDSKNDYNRLRIYDEYENWYRVRTADGIIGYMEKKHVVIKDMMVKKMPVEEATAVAWKPETGKINLVWEMMYSKRPDIGKAERIDGLDVISPTWFQVANENGTLINRADAKYVEWAHNNGYKVWALFANDFGNPAMTKKLLRNTDARDNIIRQLLSYASLYKLDGINIDFENINKEDKDVLTQFVREITPFLKEQGLVVTMDVSIPDGSDNWSLCYDRKALGGIVDYLMLMTYDQYWASSPDAGSVAQVAWVEKNLKKTLELVPREKLLLGLPFYTRLWETKPDKDGKAKLTLPAKSLTMAAAKKLIKDNNAQTKWDETSGQFYAEYKKDGASYKIWLEDENSINLKSALVQKYRLAGACSWSKTFEVPEVWSVLNKNLKIHQDYRDWLVENDQRKYVFN